MAASPNQLRVVTGRAGTRSALLLVVASVWTACTPVDIRGAPALTTDPNAQTSSQGSTVEPSVAPSPAPGACTPMVGARLELRADEVNHVVVAWRVEGGCPPFEGTITAWYQDERAPSGVYAIDEPSGVLVDAPIVHKGKWDRDCYLDVTDASGLRLHTFATITIQY